MGFPPKHDHFGVFWGYHHLRKHPYIIEVQITSQFKQLSGDKTDNPVKNIIQFQHIHRKHPELAFFNELRNKLKTQGIWLKRRFHVIQLLEVTSGGLF